MDLQQPSRLTFWRTATTKKIPGVLKRAPHLLTRKRGRGGKNVDVSHAERRPSARKGRKTVAGGDLTFCTFTEQGGRRIDWLVQELLLYLFGDSSQTGGLAVGCAYLINEAQCNRGGVGGTAAAVRVQWGKRLFGSTGAVRKAGGDELGGS